MHPLSEKQIDMMRHAIGLNYKPKHDRNYFALGEGSDGWQEWLDLEQRGYATKRKATFQSAEPFYYFYLTEKGIAAVSEQGA